jgi:hypothetical protein
LVNGNEQINPLFGTSNEANDPDPRPVLAIWIWNLSLKNGHREWSDRNPIKSTTAPWLLNQNNISQME